MTVSLFGREQRSGNPFSTPSLRFIPLTTTPALSALPVDKTKTATVFNSVHRDWRTDFRESLVRSCLARRDCRCGFTSRHETSVDIERNQSFPFPVHYYHFSTAGGGKSIRLLASRIALIHCSQLKVTKEAVDGASGQERAGIGASSGQVSRSGPAFFSIMQSSTLCWKIMTSASSSMPITSVPSSSWIFAK